MSTNQHGAQIEELIGKLEVAADAASLAIARELVEAVMELYASGFARVVELLGREGEAGRRILLELGSDEVTGSLLAAAGLHPIDLPTRVSTALEKLQRRIGSRGTVILEGIEEHTVRLRVRSGQEPLKALVEGALYQAAPDATVVIEEESKAGFVPLDSLLGISAAARVNGAGEGAAP